MSLSVSSTGQPTIEAVDERGTPDSPPSSSIASPAGIRSRRRTRDRAARQVIPLPRARQRPKRHLALHPPAYQPFALELLRTTDTFVAGATLVAVFLAVNAGRLANSDFLLIRVSIKNLLLVCGFVALWQLLFTLAGLYDMRVVRERRTEIRRLLVASAIGSLAVLGIALVEATPTFPPHLAGFYLATVTATTLGVRTVIRAVGAQTRKRAVKEILIIGSGPRAYKLLRDLEAAPESGYRLVGFVDSNPEIELKEIRDRLIGRLDDLEQILMRHPIDEVLIALPIRSCYAQIEEVIRTCERVGVESKYFADVFENAFARPEYDPSAGLPAVSLKVVQDDARLIVKRIFDLVAAGVGLIALAPLMIAIAIGIRLSGPGPIIFSQWRYGKNRRLFKMFKFRTMIPEAEQLQHSLEHLNEVDGPVFKITEDPRVTPFGRFLRRTSLDELPQLFNVLRGEMSLVGPRPLPIRDVSRFNEGRLMRRFSVLPGLTCLWQISGRNELDFDEWLRLDLNYIDRWSLRLDFLILLRTIPVVIRGTGAS